MAPETDRRIGDLVVVLQVDDEARSGKVERRCPAPLLLPGVTLPLEQETVFGEGDKLARTTAIVAVVRLSAAGQRDARTVVKIVVPDGIEPVAAVVDRARHPRHLALVFRRDEGGAPSRGLAYAAADRHQNMLGGAVENLLRRVEPQA